MHYSYDPHVDTETALRKLSNAGSIRIIFSTAHIIFAMTVNGLLSNLFILGFFG